MRLRSLLFVPGDRPERMQKALSLGADALILDLEDSVALSAKPSARRAVAEFLAMPRGGVHLFVRINPLTGGLAAEDVAAIAACPPEGIVLPKAEGAPSIGALDELLKASGCTGIKVLPIATETPAAVFELGSYRRVSHRLAGLTWGAEDLPAAIGAETSRKRNGEYTPPYELARSLTLLAAHAAACGAIETVYPRLTNMSGLKNYAERAARDGFTGMMAIHPRQIDVINAAFTPSESALEKARAIVSAFEEQPTAGVLNVDGAMVDLPHLKQARHTLARAAPPTDTCRHQDQRA